VTENDSDSDSDSDREKLNQRLYCAKNDIHPQKLASRPPGPETVSYYSPGVPLTTIFIIIYAYITLPISSKFDFIPSSGQRAQGAVVSGQAVGRLHRRRADNI
jgi:hypothetical protein